MKLIDIVAQLDDHFGLAVILVETPWSADSRASVELIRASDYTKIEKDGMSYFMLVCMAAISRDEFLKNGLRLGDFPALCAALIDQALLRSTPFDRPRPILPGRKALHLTDEKDVDDEAAVIFDHTKTLQDLFSLPAQQRARAFQSLNPYYNPPLFGAVRSAFLQAHRACGPPNEVVVGDIGRLGPLNGIAVKVAAGAKLRVPTQFMGILVEKLIWSGSSWKRARY
jgi:hypothetical protein